MLAAGYTAGVKTGYSDSLIVSAGSVLRSPWSWLSTSEASPKPSLRLETANAVRVQHNSLGSYQFAFVTEAVVLFTENETNAHRLWGTPNPTSFVKDAFHEYVIAGRCDAVNHEYLGTKCAPHFELTIQPGETRQLRLQLVSAVTAPELSFGKAFDSVFAERQRETDEF